MSCYGLVSSGVLFAAACEFGCLPNLLDSPNRLLQNLFPSAREDLRSALRGSQTSNVPAPVFEADDERQREPTPEPELAPTRLAFDSHFHLDSLQWSLHLELDTTFQQTMAAVGPVPEEYRVNLAGCTAVFCDIHFYPMPDRIML